jgi:hypothetical protein
MRASFVSRFLEDLKEDVDRYGHHKLIPFWLIGAAGVAAVIVWILPASFWTDDLDSDRIALVAGILTFNGLVLAISWSSFSKIYEIASAQGFSTWLTQKGLLNGIHFLVDFIHTAQVLAVLASFAMLLFSPATQDYPRISQALFGIMICFSIYALAYGSGAVRLMQDLVYYRHQFENQRTSPVTVVQSRK